MEIQKRLKLAVATNCLSGIGKNGDLPWETCKADMKLFRKFTMNKSCLVGRKTYESMGELPKRTMIVVGKGYHSLEEALALSPDCCIGGEQIYQSCLKLGVISAIHESKIQNWETCDAHFIITDEVLEGWALYKKSKGKKGIQPPESYQRYFLTCETDEVITVDLNETFNL